MKSRLLSVFVLLLLAIFYYSCNQVPRSKAELSQYISDENNGLSITKNTGVFKLNLTYFPSIWRAHDEKSIATNQDSLMNALNKSLLFVFTISPLEGKSEGDVFHSGVNSKQDFEARVREANFGFEDSWSLRLDDGTELSPIGVQMEQTNGLTNYRKFHILFDVSKYPQVYVSKIWDVKLHDELFNSGIHHFVIKSKNRDWFTSNNIDQ